MPTSPPTQHPHGLRRTVLAGIAAGVLASLLAAVGLVVATRGRLAYDKKGP